MNFLNCSDFSIKKEVPLNFFFYKKYYNLISPSSFYN